MDSPIVFNILSDAVQRRLFNHPEYTDSDAEFYADDGLIDNQNPGNLQEDLNIFLQLFPTFRLQCNEK